MISGKMPPASAPLYISGIMQRSGQRSAIYPGGAKKNLQKCFAIQKYIIYLHRSAMDKKSTHTSKSNKNKRQTLHFMILVIRLRNKRNIRYEVSTIQNRIHKTDVETGTHSRKNKKDLISRLTNTYNITKIKYLTP